MDPKEVTCRLIVLAVALAACPARVTRPVGPSKAIVFVTAELKGSIAPCGCSEAMRGGISRTAGVIAAARATGVPVFYLDAGDALFGSQSIADEAVAQQERKAQALAQAFKSMGLLVRGPGSLDDARGVSFRQSLNLPELKQNAVQSIDVQGRRIAVVRAETSAAAETLARLAKNDGATFCLGLVEQPLDALIKGASSSPSVDLLLSTHSKNELSAEENRVLGDRTKIAQVQSKGRSILRLDFNFAGDGVAEWVAGAGERDRELSALDTRVELLRAQLNVPGMDPTLKQLKAAKLEEVIERRKALAETPLVTPPQRNSVSLRFVPIEPGLPSAPPVAAIEAAYDKDVGLLNLAWAKAHAEACEPPDLNREGYVGSNACAGCHPDAMNVWKNTKHAQSYKALESKNKQYHLDCIGCHVTGWHRPGGVCRIDDVDGRDEVGCESCHGPGWKHTQMPFKQYISRGHEEKTCTGCHDPENSPHFEYSTYRANVVRAGHGEALLDGGWGARGNVNRP